MRSSLRFKGALLAAFSMPLFTAAAFTATPILDKVVTADPATSAAANVLQVKASKKVEGKILVKGKIKDFVKGSSVFTMVDTSLKSCADNGEACPTPWDFCCESPKEVTKNSATVIPVASPNDSKPVKESIQGVKGLKNLSTVSVYGTGKLDKAGNLMIHAEKIHVEK